ncbi:hypothetical protein [Cellulomonas sp. SG140]|uniref:hypothetical protein n=1 Tax=Cellulomonas sp. SG140 TaxID=2976536 RepID=UPI0021E6E03A|nr:hypothetical protein [Cellulomonas sp. SG140]
MPVVQASGPAFTLTDEQRALVARARAAFAADSGYSLAIAEQAALLTDEQRHAALLLRAARMGLARKRALHRAAQQRYRDSHLEQSRESWTRYAKTAKGKAAKARADRAYRQRRKERLIAPSEAEAL